MEETPLLSPASEVRTSSPACKGSPFHPLPQEPPFFFGTGDAPFFFLPMFPLLPAQSSLRSVGAGASRGSLFLQKCQPWRAGAGMMEQLGRGGGGTDGGWRINGRSFSLLLSVVGPRWAVSAAEGEVGGAPKEGEADAR